MDTLDALWASSAATIALVFITFYYAWQTRQTVKEMEKARRAEFLACIKAAIYFVSPTLGELKLQNVGKGPAINISALVKTQPEGELRRWEQPLMAPGDCEFFFLPEGDLDKLAGKYDYVAVEGSFEDLFGEEHAMSEKIELKRYLANLGEARKVWKEPEPLRHLKEIRDELGKIERRLERIERQQSGK